MAGVISADELERRMNAKGLSDAQKEQTRKEWRALKYGGGREPQPSALDKLKRLVGLGPVFGQDKPPTLMDRIRNAPGDIGDAILAHFRFSSEPAGLSAEETKPTYMRSEPDFLMNPQGISDKLKNAWLKIQRRASVKYRERHGDYSQHILVGAVIGGPIGYGMGRILDAPSYLPEILNAATIAWPALNAMVNARYGDIARIRGTKEIENVIEDFLYSSDSPLYAGLQSTEAYPQDRERAQREAFRKGYKAAYTLAHFFGSLRTGEAAIKGVNRLLSPLISSWRAFNPLSESAALKNYDALHQAYLEEATRAAAQGRPFNWLIKQGGIFDTAEWWKIASPVIKAKARLAAIQTGKSAFEFGTLSALDHYLQRANDPTYTGDSHDLALEVAHSFVAGAGIGLVFSAPFTALGVGYEVGGLYMKANPLQAIKWENFMQNSALTRWWAPNPRDWVTGTVRKQFLDEEIRAAAENEIVGTLQKELNSLNDLKGNPLNLGKRDKRDFMEATQRQIMGLTAEVPVGKSKLVDARAGARVGTNEALSLEAENLAYWEKWAKDKGVADPAWARKHHDWTQDIRRQIDDRIDAMAELGLIPLEEAAVYKGRYIEAFLSTSGITRMRQLAKAYNLEWLLPEADAAVKGGIEKLGIKRDIFIRLAQRNADAEKITLSQYIDKAYAAGKLPRGLDAAWVEIHKGEAFVRAEQAKTQAGISSPWIIEEYSPLVYSGTARDYLINAKVGKEAAYKTVAAEAAGYEGVEALAQASDVVVSAPSVRHRAAQIYGDEVANAYNLPHLDNALISTGRIKQAAKDAMKRRAQVRGQFIFNENMRSQIQGKRVLLTDDVLTTGASANEMARVLVQDGGAAEVRFTASTATLKGGAQEAVEMHVIRAGRKNPFTGEKYGFNEEENIASVVRAARERYGADSVINVGRSLDWDEAMAMGLDVSMTPVALTMARMDIRMASLQWYQDIASNPKWAAKMTPQNFEMIPKGWKLVTGRQYGALDGMHVAPHVFRDLTSLEYVPNAAENIYLGLLSNWRLAMTVLNPATHIRNLLGNQFFSFLSGYNEAAHIEFSKKAAAQMKDLVLNPKSAMENPEFVRFLKANGFGQSYLQRDMPGVMQDLKEIFAKDGLGADPAGNIAAFLRMIHKRTVQGAAGRAYGAEDLYYKYRDWLRLTAPYKQLGEEMTDALAARHIAKTYPDYSRVPSALQGNRFSSWKNNPLGAPFVSFQYETGRIMLNYAAEHPARLAAALAIPHFINRFSQYALKLSDQDMVDLLKTAGPGEPHNYHMVLLPFKGKDGAYLFWNMNYAWPSADFANMMPFVERAYTKMAFDIDLPAEMTGQQASLPDKAMYYLSGPKGAGQQVFNRMFGSNPMLTAFAEMKTGTSVFTGQPLVDERIKPEVYPQEYGKERYYTPLLRNFAPPLTVLPWWSRDPASGEWRWGTDYPDSQPYIAGYGGMKMMQVIRHEDIVKARTIERYRNPLITFFDSVMGFQARERNILDAVDYQINERNKKLATFSTSIMKFVDPGDDLSEAQRKRALTVIKRGTLDQVLAMGSMTDSQKQQVAQLYGKREALVNQIEYLKALKAKWEIDPRLAPPERKRKLVSREELERRMEAKGLTESQKEQTRAEYDALLSKEAGTGD